MTRHKGIETTRHMPFQVM